MNTGKYMIIIKGEIKTSEVRSCKYNNTTKKWDVEFSNGKTYSYAYQSIEWLSDPVVLNPHMYHISREGHDFFDIDTIYVFKNGYHEYWHIGFRDGSERDYPKSELRIAESCLNQKQAGNVFEYIKQIAQLSELKNEETGEKILAKRFEKIDFIGNNIALAKYINPQTMKIQAGKKDYVPIFPFGCNNSQYNAVKNAMGNQISVIQGPPGTGKTQTILNIIANILIQGKMVQIVSNNNSATENVYKKLSSAKYNLGFIVAALGNSENKKKFIDSQEGVYPDFSAWRVKDEQNVSLVGIREKSSQLKDIFDKQEELAVLKQEQSRLATELDYFKQYLSETDVDTDRIKEIFRRMWLLKIAEIVRKQYLICFTLMKDISLPKAFYSQYWRSCQM